VITRIEVKKEDLKGDAEAIANLNWSQGIASARLIGETPTSYIVEGLGGVKRLKIPKKIGKKIDG
jgi:hypothetical protein